MDKEQNTREIDYSDLDLDFFKLPTTKDVSHKIGAEAVKRSIRNLVLTNFYDRPFRSNIGSVINKLLFENMSPIVEAQIKNAIIEVITNFEPRASILDVIVKSSIEDNAYGVAIAFYINNREEPIVTSILLERIR